MTKQVFFSVAFTVISIYSTFGQIDEHSDLFIELKMQDSIFFERGFNQCDFNYLESRIAKDLRFYHDQSGLQDRNTFFENTQKYICVDSAQKPIRKLEANSLEVFPLSNNGEIYGAIQKGVHHFYLREKDKEDVWTSTAKFTNVWILESEIWKIREVLSYDHQDPALGKQKNRIETLLQDNNVPALGIGIIENGKLTKVEMYGTLDTQRTAAHNTIFNVASLTKPIIALTTLKLIDKGLLSLDEPLHKYWIDPEIEHDDRYLLLTPKIVLSHQTGFPNWRYLKETNELSFEFDPGTSFQYSGEGFEYLKRAIERKLNKDIEELAEEILFKPLGMSDTHFWWNSEVEEKRYAQNFNSNGEIITTEKHYEANAAANLLTTVEDYGKFLEHLIDGAGLSENLYGEMLKHQVQLKHEDYFGLGWEILTGFSNNEIALIHSGKDPGISTVAVWFPKSKNGYLVFLNGDNVDKIYQELFTKRLYFGNDLWDRR